MNFLAHLYLSGNDEQLMIGNFIADSVKGSAFKNYPEGIAKGIMLHRAIDFYSDNHPVFKQSIVRLRLSPLQRGIKGDLPFPLQMFHPAFGGRGTKEHISYGKYCGVIVDIFYDHFLAKNWEDYSEQPLEQYASKAHSLMMKNIFIMPKKSLMFLKYAMRTNRLVSYATLDGIGTTLSGMSRRTTFKSNMEFAVNDLKEYYPLFENEFRIFFKDAREYVHEYLTKY